MPKLRGCTAAKELLRNSSGEQDYLYNGKEFNEDLGLKWYAYGFRYYDPTIGKFTGVDPIADRFPELSVYNYASNNPVSRIDLHGLQGAEGVWISQLLINKFIDGKARVGGHLNNLSQGATKSNPTINNAPISQESKNFLHKAQTNAGAAGVANEVLESVQTVGTTVHPYYAAGAGLLTATIEAEEGNYGVALFTLAMIPLDFGPGKGAGKITEEALSKFMPTHYITKSESQMKILLDDIRVNGVVESIKYVENSGVRYIVDGHHRYYAAQKLGLQTIPAQEVDLPYKGYSSTMDLILEPGRQPGYWQYLK